MDDSVQGEARGFLDYYGEHRVIPVSQEHIPRDTYRSQRLNLYRRLGIPAPSFTGLRILEIGPGTGRNAEILQELRPRSLHLLDGNPASIAAIDTRIATGALGSVPTHVIEADFHDEFSDLGTFDVVLAEGCLPMQNDPLKSLESVARFVSPHYGALVITCSEPLGLIAEICRRLLKPMFLSLGQGDFERSVELAATFFAEDLSSLPAITRTPRDWVVDQIFHPWPNRWYLSIDEALEDLHDFEFLGSVPNFMTDWSWYKIGPSPTTESVWSPTRQWGAYRPALVDYRIQSTEIRPFDDSIANELQGLSTRLDRAIQSIWRSSSYEESETVRSIIWELRTVMDRVPMLRPATIALAEFHRALPRLVAGELDVDLGNFRSWWGRGQQYLSVMRSRRAE